MKITLMTSLVLIMAVSVGEVDRADRHTFQNDLKGSPTRQGFPTFRWKETMLTSPYDMLSEVRYNWART